MRHNLLAWHSGSGLDMKRLVCNLEKKKCVNTKWRIYSKVCCSGSIFRQSCLKQTGTKFAAPKCARRQESSKHMRGTHKRSRGGTTTHVIINFHLCGLLTDLPCRTQHRRDRKWLNILSELKFLANRSASLSPPSTSHIERIRFPTIP